MTQKLNVFVPIRKVDEEKRLVYGTMTEEMPDKDDEIMDYKSSKPHFEKWSQEISDATEGKSLGNVRVMHGPMAAGKLTDIQFLDDDKRIECCAHIVDDNEWNKVREGVYTGFSVGGSYENRWPDMMRPSLTRFTAVPVEVSLVDNPCCPSAHFSVIKAAGATEQRMFKAAELAAEHDAMIQQSSKGLFAKFLGWMDSLAKTQQAAADGFQRPASPSKPTEGGPQIEDDSEFDDGFNKRDFSREKRKELAESGAALPDGSYPIQNLQDLKNAIRAYGRAKDKDKAKRHIIARAKALGHADELPEDWHDSKKAAQVAQWVAKGVSVEDAEHMADNPDMLALFETAWSQFEKSAAPATLKSGRRSLAELADSIPADPIIALTKVFDLAPEDPQATELDPMEAMAKMAGEEVTHLDEITAFINPVDEDMELLKNLTGITEAPLAKSMGPLYGLISAFETIRDAQRSLIREGKIESDEGDRALAAKLGEIASGLATVIGQKAEHEGGEAVPMTDELDLVFADLTGISLQPGVTKMTQPSLDDLLKRASKAHHEHHAKGMHHLNKAMECHKCGMEEMAKLAKHHLGVHEAHKAADGDHHKVTARLIKKAHDHFSQAGDHHEMAHHHFSLAKGGAESGHARGGKDDQGSQRVEDHFAGTEIPEGELTLHSLESMLEGHVPDMPNGEGPYGKGVLAALIKATEEAAYQKGRAETLEKMPASGPRPHNPMFAVGNLHGDLNDTGVADLAKAAGNVDMNDPESRTRAAARAVGHMITHPQKFGKSVMDADFNGQAGAKRA